MAGTVKAAATRRAVSGTNIDNSCQQLPSASGDGDPVEGQSSCESKTAVVSATAQRNKGDRDPYSKNWCAGEY